MSQPSVQTAGRAMTRTHKLTVTAMLSAVAFVLYFIDFPIPMLMPSFVTMDVSDLPELLAAFALGPVYGVAVAFIKNLLHIVVEGTVSAYAGPLFSFIMGSVFAFTAGLIYQRHKTRRNALAGALAGAALMAVLSVPLNYYVVYPAYEVLYGMPMDAIVGAYQKILPSMDSLLKCLIVFNLPWTFCKGLLCTALCFLVYKPLSPLLHR